VIAYAQIMARYNVWMNERLYETCASLTDEARKSDVGAFFRSIHGTLNHILLADRSWMARFRGKPATFKSLDEELYGDFAELRRERMQDDQRIIEWATALDARDVARPLSFKGITSPELHSYPFSLVVAHFFNHQTHHRGQITTLLSQCGIDPGVTDLLRLPGPLDA
jgi:uncharacterized damage-inducible protein DinB